MSFLGVKVILFLVIPLIIKEKSNASALNNVFVVWKKKNIYLCKKLVKSVFALNFILQ